MRVLFAGGGTAGHLSPCIAIAQALRRTDPDVEVAFAISTKPSDASMLQQRGLSGYPLSGSGMPYGCGLGALTSLVRLAAGGCQALGLLRRLRPDVVLATGGYISAAVVPAARLLRVPVMLLAADVMPDRTNRTLSRWAELVATVSEGAADVFTNTPTIVTGMPVRPEILDVDPAAARQQLVIAPSATVLLVTGGSQGAQRINEATVAALPHLLNNPDVFIIHLTGVGKLPAPEQLKGLPEDRYLVTERRDDMGTCLAAADIVLTRAGANGVAEAAAWGRPMIVVPYPHAGGHQRLNAEIYEKAGAAVVIDDADFTGDVLLSTIQNLRANPERLSEMARAAKEQGSATAAEQIAAELRRLAAGRDSPRHA